MCQGARALLALGAMEANWALARGHNLKVTELRAGVRYSDGIPQLEGEHTRLYFLELHGFF